jgi:hypothetical protein
VRVGSSAGAAWCGGVGVAAAGTGLALSGVAKANSPRTVGRVIAVGVAATACWINGSWMRVPPAALRLAGSGAGKLVRAAAAFAALAVGGEGVALGVAVGGGIAVGLGDGSGIGAAVCVGALVGTVDATTGAVVGVLVGVAETVGVAVKICAT